MRGSGSPVVPVAQRLPVALGDAVLVWSGLAVAGTAARSVPVGLFL